MNLNYSTFHAFNYANTYYLYDNENLVSCIVSSRVFNALDKKDSTGLNDEEKRLLEEFYKREVFFIEEPENEYCAPIYDELIVSMAVFHGCNLNCKYCFADAGASYKEIQKSFTTESINAAIDFMLNDPFFKKFDKIRINLVGGGEPLIERQLFHNFVDTVFNRFNQAGKHLYVWFSTNGTLLTVDDLLFISKYNVGYGISIDGDKFDNNETRKYADGSGTYDDIVHNIKEIQNSPVVPNRLKELWGLLVLSQKNLNILKNIKHLYDLGFSTIQIRFVRSKKEDLFLNSTQTIPVLLQYINELFMKAIEGDDSLLRLITNDSDYIGKIIKRLITQTISKVRCSIGSGMFSFAANGDIYPCDCLVGNPKFVMGNFYSSIHPNQYQKYKDLSIHKREKCSKCWAKNVCGGDCYHNSYLNNGNLLTPDDTYCEIMLKLIEAIIANLNQYMLQNREGYSEFANYIRVRDLMSSK